jgi:hypothetical protein
MFGDGIGPGSNRDVTSSGRSSSGSIFNALFTLLSSPIETEEAHRFREPERSNGSAGRGTGRKDGAGPSKLSGAKGAMGVGPAGAVSEVSLTLGGESSRGGDRSDGGGFSRTNTPVIFMSSISVVIFGIASLGSPLVHESRTDWLIWPIL